MKFFRFGPVWVLISGSGFSLVSVLVLSRRWNGNLGSYDACSVKLVSKTFFDWLTFWRYRVLEAPNYFNYNRSLFVQEGEQVGYQIAMRKFTRDGKVPIDHFDSRRVWSCVSLPREIRNQTDTND